MPRQFNIAEAKAKLSELAEAASRGEEIVLARHGKPIARIAPLAASAGQRKFGQEEKYARHIDWDQWWRDWKRMDRETEEAYEASPLFPPSGFAEEPPEKTQRAKRKPSSTRKRR